MPDKYEEIIGDAPTLRMIERIQQNRALIQVYLKDKLEPWSSTIITVDNNNHYWLFDELPTMDGHKTLIKNKQCNIETRLGGILVKFTAKIVDVGTDKNGVSYYKSLPPRVIRVYQRRSNFRATIPASQRATIMFTVPGLTPIRGRVHDISLGGVGVNLGTWTPVIDTGLYIPSSSITLPDDKIINCELKVCFVRRTYSGALMGARFEKISRDDQKRVSQFVTFIDRELARKKRLE